MSTLGNYMFQSFNFRNREKLKPFYGLVSTIFSEELGRRAFDGNRVQQPAPVQTRQFRIVRTGAEPLQRRCLPSAGTSTSTRRQRTDRDVRADANFVRNLGI